jgi:hypothetical protein
LFTRVVNHCVIVHGTKPISESIAPADEWGDSGAGLTALDWRMTPARGEKLASPHSSAASGGSAYGVLASGNQVLLTMAG